MIPPIIGRSSQNIKLESVEMFLLIANESHSTGVFVGGVYVEPRTEIEVTDVSEVVIESPDEAAELMIRNLDESIDVVIFQGNDDEEGFHFDQHIRTAHVDVKPDMPATIREV